MLYIKLLYIFTLSKNTNRIEKKQQYSIYCKQNALLCNKEIFGSSPLIVEINGEELKNYIFAQKSRLCRATFQNTNNEK